MAPAPKGKRRSSVRFSVEKFKLRQTLLTLLKKEFDAAAKKHAGRGDVVPGLVAAMEKSLFAKIKVNASVTAEPDALASDRKRVRECANAISTLTAQKSMVSENLRRARSIASEAVEKSLVVSDVTAPQVAPIEGREADAMKECAGSLEKLNDAVNLLASATNTLSDAQTDRIEGLTSTLRSVVHHVDAVDGAAAAVAPETSNRRSSRRDRSATRALATHLAS